MCFSTPFIANTSSGTQKGMGGDCLILDPSFPDKHGTLPEEDEGFRNDWIHVEGSAVPHLIRRFHLPLNRIFSVGNATMRPR